MLNLMMHLATAQLCLETPRQRGYFPMAAYNAQITNSTFCGYDLGPEGVPWIENGGIGGVCGVPQGSSVYKAGPVQAIYTAEQSIRINFQQNAAFVQCGSSSLVTSLSTLENPLAVCLLFGF